MQKLRVDEMDRKSPEAFRAAQKLTIIPVLENIRSAYNVGSVFRTADAFLLESVFLTGYTAVPPHKEIKKTALGAEETVAWQKFSTASAAIEALRSNGYRIFAVEQAKGSCSLEKSFFGPAEKVGLIFGNEVSGVEQSTIDACDGCIEIPQLGMKHSLNIATAAGVVLWELVRQRI